MRSPFLRACCRLLTALCAGALLSGDGVTARACAAPGGEGAGTGSEEMRDLAALAEKARLYGSLKVLVSLRVTGGDAATGSGAPLPLTERDGDREQRIRVAAESVLKGLGATRYRVYRRYTSLPLIAIEASPEAIEALATIAEVGGVREDAARPLK